ncbi:MAG: hypothetical protein ACHQ4H_00855 [Ktedonobacterales bacterium]
MSLNALNFTGTPVALARQIEVLVVRPGSLPEALAAFTEWLRTHVRASS